MDFGSAFTYPFKDPGLGQESSYHRPDYHYSDCRTALSARLGDRNHPQSDPA